MRARARIRLLKQTFLKVITLPKFFRENCFLVFARVLRKTHQYSYLYITISKSVWKYGRKLYDDWCLTLATRMTLWRAALWAQVIYLPSSGPWKMLIFQHDAKMYLASKESENNSGTFTRRPSGKIWQIRNL